MHQFPPAPFPQSTLILTLLQTIVFGLFLAAIIRLFRSSRTPRVYDILIINILVIVTITFLHTPRRRHLGYSEGYIPLILVTFLVAAGAILLKIDDYSDNRVTKKTALKSLFVFLQCVIFVYIPIWFISSAGSTGVRFAYERNECRINLREVGIAVQEYVTQNEGNIPATAAGNPPRSWRVELLPFLEQASLHEKYNKKDQWNSGTNSKIAKTKIEIYTCPANPIRKTKEGFPVTAFAALTGKNAAWRKTRSGHYDDITYGDGSSQTLLLVEACGQLIAWSEPRDVDINELPVAVNQPGNQEGCSSGVISSYHGGGANVAFADGSLRMLSENIDPEVLKALCTATGGEKLDPDDF